MKIKTTLLVVKDIQKSKQFYSELFDMHIEMDAGANIELSGGLSLQTADSWGKFINKEESDIVFANNASEIYFEIDDMNSFKEKLNSIPDIVYLQPLTEQPWGQMSMRFCDFDGHIIEVGENLSMTVKRFLDSGLSIDDIAIRMDVDVDFINKLLSESN